MSLYKKTPGQLLCRPGEPNLECNQDLPNQINIWKRLEHPNRVDSKGKLAAVVAIAKR